MKKGSHVKTHLGSNKLGRYKLKFQYESNKNFSYIQPLKFPMLTFQCIILLDIFGINDTGNFITDRNCYFHVDFRCKISWLG